MRRRKSHTMWYNTVSVCSKQVQNIEKDGLHRITTLAAAEIAPMPNLEIKSHKVSIGMAGANLALQLKERGYECVRAQF